MMWNVDSLSTQEIGLSQPFRIAIRSFLFIVSVILVGLAIWSSIIDAEPETTIVLFGSIGTVVWLSSRRTIQNKVNFLKSQVMASRLGLGSKDQEDQALVSLHGILGCRRPLPPMGGYRITPQSALLLASIAMRHKPEKVVELGSGISSLILGYCREKNQSGEIFSFEHEEGYAAKTQELLEEHGLSTYVTLRTAPLKPWNHDREMWTWYDLDRMEGIEDADMLFVDGPPAKLQALSRYPAVPALIDKLRPGALVILDDVNRAHETAIVKRWVREYGLEIVQIFHADKGMAVLRVPG